MKGLISNFLLFFLMLKFLQSRSCICFCQVQIGPSDFRVKNVHFVTPVKYGKKYEISGDEKTWKNKWLPLLLIVGEQT